jgi:hypothetical protein
LFPDEYVWLASANFDLFCKRLPGTVFGFKSISAAEQSILALRSEDLPLFKWGLLHGIKL